MKKTFKETKIEFIYVDADVITASTVGADEGNTTGGGTGLDGNG